MPERSLQIRRKAIKMLLEYTDKSRTIMVSGKMHDFLYAPALSYQEFTSSIHTFFLHKLAKGAIVFLFKKQP